MVVSSVAEEACSDDGGEKLRSSGWLLVSSSPIWRKLLSVTGKEVNVQGVESSDWVLPCSAEWMADASHPTPEGYRAQAQWLLDQADFRDWLETLEIR